MKSLPYLCVFSLAACASTQHAPSADGAHHDAGHGHASEYACGEEHSGHHSFKDATKWATRFEAEDRDEWQKPDLVITALELRRTDVVADIGSATGYFPVRIAPVIPEGKMIGVDIEPEMVTYLNKRASDESLSNLSSVLGTPADPNLPTAANAILVVNTYHHISDRVAYLENLKRYLAPGARVAIVDFVQGDLPFGPPNHMKLAPEAVEAEFAEAGYITTKRVQGLPYQYMLVFEQGGSAAP